MHGLAKAGLFLCAGIVIHATGERDIRRLGGQIKNMPWTAAAFIFCAFSVIGIPPFGGFFSKFMVIMATVQSGRVWVAAAALFAAILTMYYLFKVFSAVFMGEPAGHGHPEGTRSMVWVVVTLAVLSLLAGLLVAYPTQLANVAAGEILRWIQ
jgi:NADH:ubiquinone oxidoreductase subunit 5 (subunit L)/multisubunit Na+/H+ antiporter MnhA subunit